MVRLSFSGLDCSHWGPGSHCNLESGGRVSHGGCLDHDLLDYPTYDEMNADHPKIDTGDLASLVYGCYDEDLQNSNIYQCHDERSHMNCGVGHRGLENRDVDYHS